MAGFTKERLMALSNRENVGAICSDEIAAMARQLLAGMEQEPVAEISQAQEYDLEGHLRHQRDIDYYQDDIDKLPVGTKLYAAPQLPQPAVPDEWTIQDAVRFCKQTGRQDAGAAMEAWNACRAAMLQGAEHVSLPDELRDGWVAVPVEMTPEQMRAVQRDSSLGTFASAHLAGAYDMYREFWDVAIAAAPQQEVK